MAVCSYYIKDKILYFQMGKKMLNLLLVALQIVFGYYLSFSQCQARVTHTSGDSLVECIDVHVSSQGVVDVNPNGCPETGPYNVGYNFTSKQSANGSYTFTFTPAIHSLALNFTGVSYLSYVGRELIRLYVNGQHYKLSGASAPSVCNPFSPLAVLTEDGDITGCDECGAADWKGTVITGDISTLTVLDSCTFGYGNGTKFSLDICGNPIQSANLGNDTILCEGQTLLLDITTPNSTYRWQDGSENSTFTVTKKGTYWVAVQNDCGEKKDTIYVDYISPVHFSFEKDTILCYPDAIMLDAYQPGSSYLWQDNSTNPNFLVAVEGKYWVDVSNRCGTSSDTANVNYFPSQGIYFGTDTTLCTGSILYLDARIGNSSQYLWQDGSTQPIFIVTKPGTYQVKTKNICPITSSALTVHYHSCHCVISFPSAFTPNHDGRNDEFLPKFDCDFTDYSLKIYNRWGQQIFHSISNTKAWDGTYNGIPQPIGTYTYLFTYRIEAGERKTDYGQITLLR